MKILELRFKNLNSIYGEWFIDFTDPEYVSSGIFALTGPTGAGKSTILDAVCLGLYGATPRLGKITKGGNEIMSRQTGECYAEVVFESQAGRFRCHWEQRRSRKKTDGALQYPEHQVADALTGKPIETRRSLVAGIIEEKTGMDFDRFTRSILLAQGGFDTFLKADVEQKSRILEQITGTGIYSEISRRVHERQREEREKLTLLQAETSGIAILDPAQEQQIQQDLEAGQKQETELATQAAATRSAITWLTGIKALEQEIRLLAQEAEKRRMEIEAFKPERERLARSVRAAALDGSYATLTSVRAQQSADQADLKTAQEKLPGLEKDAARQATVLAAAENQTLRARDDLNQAVPLIQKVRLLDQALAGQKKAVCDGEAGYTKAAAKIDADKALLARVQERRSKAAMELELSDQYLRDNARDEWLSSGLTGVEEQLNGLVAREREITRKKGDQDWARTALEKAVNRLNRCTAQCRIHKQALADAVTEHGQGTSCLKGLLGDRLLREYRTEKETLLRELAFLEKIAALKAHRTRLEDGRPCPLCGSEDHPFARGNVPVPDRTEKKIASLAGLIKKAEDQETTNRALEKAENEARSHLTEADARQAAAVSDHKAAEKSLSDLTHALDTARSEFEDLTKAVFCKLEPLGIEPAPDLNVARLVESLKARLGKWQAQVRQRAEIDKRISNLDSELKRLDAVIEARKNALAEKKQALDSLKKDHDQGCAQRRALYADKDSRDQEALLNRAISGAEQAEKKVRDVNDKLRQGLAAAMAGVDALKERIARREPELERLESDFSASLQAAGFSDEQLFLVARLTTVERDGLAARARELDDGQTDLLARQKDRSHRLTLEIEQRVTDSSVEVLEPQARALDDALKQIRDTIAGFNHRLSENRVARQRIRVKQAAIEVQKQEFNRWEKLHALIGSADGKKYRNFAQGLTFELMVSHANRQLERMTDRYLLVRDEEKPLELNVVDNYQAGEIRSTRNLSGGESFIVSLTLALGLSRMASRRVRVDSLFLDEGFGTLDEEALENALETLSGLHQDGKLIGIISHVPALKERIPTQITVSPVSGGRSTLAGPGCSRVMTKEQ